MGALKEPPAPERKEPEMTCIVGLLDKGDIYIGGDSAGVAGYSLSVRSDHKVFIRDEFIMGFTSSFRMGQLLRYRLYLPKIGKDRDIFDFMVTDFIDAVRECLKKGGYARKEHEVESGGCFIVGYRSRIFIIDSDFQVGENNYDYAAVGCGEDIALGAMYANQKRPPRERITQALSAAEQFSAGVRRPFTILKLERR
jgi:ATP-dependent protease HslVU (ClpYQ) peptidase subunit